MFIGEKRQSDRLEIKLDGKCYRAGKELKLSITNISLGGAFITTKLPIFIIGEKIELILSIPSTSSSDLVIYSEILRKQILPDGKLIGYGLKFIMVEPRQQKELESYLETSLLTGETSHYASPRLSTIYDLLILNKAQEAKAQLENISSTGIYFLSREDLDQNKEIVLNIYHPGKKTNMKIKAEVVRSEVRTLSGNFYYGIGAKFIFEDNLEMQKLIDDFISYKKSEPNQEKQNAN